MTWQDACRTYPNQWLLIEALEAYSKEQYRILEAIAVLNHFADSQEAFKQYKVLHHTNRNKEYYVVHTSQENLNIPEVQWLGIRGAA
jgi:cytochrome oxidase Cu insertion factor (SCO1/SenC/PrrC family)